MPKHPLLSRGSALVAAFLLLPLCPASAQDAPAKPAEPAKVAATPLKLPDVVAVINGKEIRSEELTKNLQETVGAAGRSVEDLPPEQLMTGYRMLLEEMITEQIVTQSAKDVKVTDAEVDEQFAEIKDQFPDQQTLEKQIAAAGETVASVRADIRKSLQQQKWIEKQIGDRAKVTEADAEAFYKGNPDQFKVPETVRASHILITVPPDAAADVAEAKQTEIKKIAARIEKGEDFAAVAKEVSEDPGSKETGGDLDYFARDRMVPEFAEAAFSLVPGKVSDPVKTQFGYHLIKVTGKKDARTVPFEEAKERIMGYLGEQKKREAIDTVIREAREKADVKSNLPAAPADAPAGS